MMWRAIFAMTRRGLVHRQLCPLEHRRQLDDQRAEAAIQALVVAVAAEEAPLLSGERNSVNVDSVRMVAVLNGGHEWKPGASSYMLTRLPRSGCRASVRVHPLTTRMSPCPPFPEPTCKRKAGWDAGLLRERQTLVSVYEAPGFRLAPRAGLLTSSYMSSLYRSAWMGAHCSHPSRAAGAYTRPLLSST